MKIPLLSCAALIGMSCLPAANASILTFDLFNPSSDGIVAEIQGSLDNVTGSLTTTYIIRPGDFFNGEYQFNFNVGNPSRGPVIEQELQNFMSLGPVATLSNATTFSVTEGPGGADYEGTVVGWQAGDTIITCGDTFPAAECSFFETGVYSFESGSLVSAFATSGILQSGSPQTAPEPDCLIPLGMLSGAFLVARKRSRIFVK